MEQIIKAEIVGIINNIQRGDAPLLENNEIAPEHFEIASHKFDLVDTKQGSPIQEFEKGTAHYITIVR